MLEWQFCPSKPHSSTPHFWFNTWESMLQKSRIWKLMFTCKTDNIFHQHFRLSLQRATVSLIQVWIYCEGKDRSKGQSSAQWQCWHQRHLRLCDAVGAVCYPCFSFRANLLLPRVWMNVTQVISFIRLQRKHATRDLSVQQVSTVEGEWRHP